MQASPKFKTSRRNDKNKSNKIPRLLGGVFPTKSSKGASQRTTDAMTKEQERVENEIPKWAIQSLLASGGAVKSSQPNPISRKPLPEGSPFQHGYAGSREVDSIPSETFRVIPNAIGSQRILSQRMPSDVTASSEGFVQRQSPPVPSRSPPPVPSETYERSPSLDHVSATPLEVSESSPSTAARKRPPIPFKPLQLRSPMTVKKTSITRDVDVDTVLLSTPRNSNASLSDKGQENQQILEKEDNSEVVSNNLRIIEIETEILHAEVETLLEVIQKNERRERDRLARWEVSMIRALEIERLGEWERYVRAKEQWEEREREHVKREKQEQLRRQLEREQREKAEKLERERQQHQERMAEFERWLRDREQREIERQQSITAAELEIERRKVAQLEQERLANEQLLRQQALQLRAELERRRQAELQLAREEQSRRERSERQAALQNVGAPVAVSKVSWGKILTMGGPGLRDLTPAILKQLAIIRKNFLESLPGYTITSIEYVMNDALYTKFNHTKAEFRNHGRDTKEWLVFHGTKPENVDKFHPQGKYLSDVLGLSPKGLKSVL